MDTWVLCLLLTGLTDISGEEAQDVLEMCTDSPICQGNTGNSHVVSGLISSS